MANQADVQVIEVNGVKLEVDMRYARRIDTLRVGSKVKVMTKGYGNDFKVHSGVVVGFEPFPDLPTIIVAYVEASWSSSELKFQSINSKTEGFQIVAAVDDDLQLDREQIIAQMNREITKKEQEIDGIRERISYFERNFKAYWEQVLPA